MKVKRFILRDSCDSQFDDLITFENEVLLDDIYSTIADIKYNVEDYTNEDIYQGLTNLGNFTIDYIGQLDIVEY